ncbi:MAG: siroheme synthase [Methanomicrobiales archaeon HGW-Methanomicrobiales-3]|jgi:precorrin-2 dehydrogenase/sirohydrochlorin ferrochelatase|nr:MAG: siroheme synthase [Methanomicrobiales archaeon HGW-Methanomicrobiales-3]
MIPLFIDFSGRRIVIFGGGDVAARKAAYFSGNADVVVVSRTFAPAFDDMKVTRKDLDIVTESGRNLAALLTGAFLVIAATSDPEVNNRIGRLCKATGILFNNANGETGDVVMPAVTRGDNFTIAVSTGGNSPAVSRYIREKIDDAFPTLDEMIALQIRLREVLRVQEPDQKKRATIIAKVLHDPTVWAALEAKRPDVWEDVRRRYLS